MKILIVCSAKAAMTWEKRYNSAEFDRAIRYSQDCDIESVESSPTGTNGRPVYVSTQKSALQTAKKLFTDADTVAEKLLDEVPERAYKDTDKKFPLRQWQFMAKWQRFLGNNRQPETKKQAIARAEQLIGLLEERSQDCIVVSHPIFLKVLLNRLKAHGYCVTRGGSFRIAPLERILITRWDMHCGGCGHNCLLTSPGCGVGRDVAKRRK